MLVHDIISIYESIYIAHLAHAHTRRTHACAHRITATEEISRPRLIREHGPTIYIDITYWIGFVLHNDDDSNTTHRL